MNNREKIAQEIGRQFRCSLYFSINKENTKKWIIKSVLRLCDEKTARDEIKYRLDWKFLEEHPIPDDFTEFEPSEILLKKKPA